MAPARRPPSTTREHTSPLTARARDTPCHEHCACACPAAADSRALTPCTPCIALRLCLLSYGLEPAVYNAHRRGGADAECLGVDCFRVTHLVCAAVAAASLACSLLLHRGLARLPAK